MKRFPSIVVSGTKLRQLENYLIEGTTYLISSSVRQSNQHLEFYGFQGSGVLGSDFTDSVESLKNAWDTSNSISPPEQFSRFFRGAAIAYIKDLESNILYILPDLLGEAILYKYSYNGTQILSGDLLEIKSIVSTLNLPLTKSLDYALELAISSNGGFTKSSYDEITSVNTFEYLEVSNNVVTNKIYSDGSDFFHNDESYEQLLEKAASEIKNNVRAASEHDTGRHIAHLTGGFDSRLVLAAIKSANVLDKFKFYCKGNPVQEETKIAESAAAKVGATMTRHAGTSETFSPQDYGGQTLGPLLISGGMLSVGPHRGNQTHSLTLLSGGYGETFRSFYGSRIGTLDSDVKLTGQTFGEKIWSRYLFSNDGSGLFTSKFIQTLTSKIDSELERGRDLGVSESDLGDYLYLQIRNRYFVGIITTNWNRYITRFDPLYSPSAIRLAFSIPLSERQDNMVGYDLMKMLAPELLEIPFDSRKFGDSVAYKRGFESPTSYSFVRPKFDDTQPFETNFIETGILEIPRSTKEDVEYARKINARPGQIAGRAHVRDALSRILRNYDDERLANIFNMSELTMLRKKPANTRLRIRTLYGLFAALSWLSDEITVGRVALDPNNDKTNRGILNE